MPAISASAPGKIILFGEHAVVYGRPAIAVPVLQVRAKAIVRANPRAQSGQVFIQAPDINLNTTLDDLPTTHPIAAAIRAVTSTMHLQQPPACNLRITSTIPIAAGMGSGAAVTVAILRALSAFWGNPLNDEQVSGMAYEVEKIHHGTPSGIDNHVVTYAMPVYFRRGHPVETLGVPIAFEIVIGNTGISSPTAVAVGDVRKAWQSDPIKYNTWFDEVSAIVESAREAIEAGQIDSLGPLMDHNHALLQQMQVSSPELDRLVEAARAAGAPGAKLSGGGRGGNMIALVKDGNAQPIIKAIQTAGGTDVLVTRIR